jgi:hypothetical protein
VTDAATIETIWVTDAELIRRSGVPENYFRPMTDGALKSQACRLSADFAGAEQERSFAP